LTENTPPGVNPNDAFVAALSNQDPLPRGRSWELPALEDDRPCWLCDALDLEVLPPAFETRAVTICRNCGLIQVRDRDSEAENAPIGTFLNIKPFSNLVLQASRMAKYLEVIERSLDFSKIRSCVDVGCDQGLFLEIVRSKYPHVECLGIDPNEGAIEYGREMYPTVAFETATIEDFEPDGRRFDLIIFTASIYRVRTPKKVLEKLHAMLNEGGHLVTILNFYVEETYRVRAESYRGQPGHYGADFETAFLDGDLRLLFNTGLAENLHAQYFDIINAGYEENTTLRREFRSFYIFCQKTRNEFPGSYKRDKNYYDFNKANVLNYMARESVRNLDGAVGKHVENVVVIGAGPEASGIVTALKQAGRTVVGVMHPLAHLYGNATVGGEPIGFIDYQPMIESDIDAVILADPVNQEHYLRLMKEVFRDLMRFPLYAIVYGQHPEQLFFSFDGETYQRYPFYFRQLFRNFDKNREVLVNVNLDVDPAMNRSKETESVTAAATGPKKGPVRRLIDRIRGLFVHEPPIH